MGAFADFFKTPQQLYYEQQQAARQATIDQVNQQVGGNLQPFQAELFPGEDPIPGLQTGQAGVLQESPERDFITQLLGSGNEQFQNQGLGLAQQAIAQQGKSDIAAKAREALQSHRQSAVGNLEELTPFQQFAGDVFSGGGPSSAEAFKQLSKQFDPFTLSQGQARFVRGKQVAKGLPDLEKLDKKRQQSFENSTKLRNQFVGVTKEFESQNTAYGRVIASADEPSAAGDLALIFNYMKVLDPASVVRESEFATAAASGSFGDRIQAAALKIAKGERLSPAQRRDFVNRAGKLFNQASRQHKVTSKEFSTLATRQGLDPENVVFERQTVATPKESPKGFNVSKMSDDELKAIIGGQ